MRPALITYARIMLLGSLAAAGCGGERDTDARPNVLLITVDTLRADYLSSYGFPLETSPNVDALARDGVVFERAIAAATSTAPSHASIFTSKYIRQHSVGWRNGDSKLQGASTLAEVFRWEGYATGAFVGNFMLRAGLGFEQGFDVYDDELSEAELNRSNVLERIAEQTTARAIEWLGGVDGVPFFLWVHYQDPHGPYTPPSAYEGKFETPADPDEKTLPVLDDYSGHKGIPDYQALEGLDRPSQYKSRYADEIFYADHWLGRLLEATDSHASGRDTIVLFTSDHGESMGEEERYFVHSYTTTPGEAHVPMILRAPGLEPQRRSEIVSHVDVMPTLLELAGIDSLAPASGIALGPLLRARQRLPDRLIYCDIGTEVSAYWSGGFVRVQAESVPALLRQAEEPGRRPWPRYAWELDGSWSVSPGNGIPDQPIRAYLSRVTPIKRAEELEPADVERLRALGYVGH